MAASTTEPANSSGVESEIVVTSTLSLSSEAKTVHVPEYEQPSYISSERSEWYTSGRAFLANGEFELALDVIEKGIHKTKELIANFQSKRNDSYNEFDVDDHDDNNKSNKTKSIEVDDLNLHESLAPLHYLYGTTLLYSIEESDENQAMTVGGKIPIEGNSNEMGTGEVDGSNEENDDNEDNQESDCEGENECSNENESSGEAKISQEELKDGGALSAGAVEDSAEDMQIAWENLELARAIIERIIPYYKTSNPSLVSKLNMDLAQVYLREGDLQRTNSKYEDAIADYDRSLQLLLLERPNNNNDSDYDRKIADVYYNLGLTYFMFVAASKTTTTSSCSTENNSSSIDAFVPVDGKKEECIASTTNVDQKQKVDQARNLGFEHYVLCAFTFGGIIAKQCQVDVEDFLRQFKCVPAMLPSDIETNRFKESYTNNNTLTRPNQTNARVASWKVSSLRKKLRDLVAQYPNDTTNICQTNQKWDEILSVLDEIQETIDEAESSEQGVQEVSAMKESIAAAVAQQAPPLVSDSHETIQMDNDTRTIIATSATFQSTTTGASSNLNVITSVRKKPKKRDALTQDEVSTEHDLMTKRVKKIDESC